MDLLDIKQVAGKLGCCPRTVTRLVNTGQAPKPIKIGRQNRWIRKTLEEWIGAGCPPCQAPQREAA